MKRNDIVYYNKDDCFKPYGRINKTVSDTHVQVIDCGKFVRILPICDLTLVENYTGYWYCSGNGCATERFHRMPTLRRLKQMTARYDPSVWKHKKKKRRLVLVKRK